MLPLLLFSKSKKLYVISTRTKWLKAFYASPLSFAELSNSKKPVFMTWHNKLQSPSVCALHLRLSKVQNCMVLILD